MKLTRRGLFGLGAGAAAVVAGVKALSSERRLDRQTYTKVIRQMLDAEYLASVPYGVVLREREIRHVRYVGGPIQIEDVS